MPFYASGVPIHGQFGINGDPSVMSQWRGRNLRDDPVLVTNSRGTLSFATGGPNTRTTQVGKNVFLSLWEREREREIQDDHYQLRLRMINRCL